MAKPHLKFIDRITEVLGSTFAIGFALGLIIIWLPTLFFLELDTSQLLINTATTIITFLMVFILQNTQNRDSRAIHAKLDALIGAIPDAPDDLRRSEDLSVKEIESLRQ